jgi:hypothetical protein
MSFTVVLLIAGGKSSGRATRPYPPETLGGSAPEKSAKLWAGLLCNALRIWELSQKVHSQGEDSGRPSTHSVRVRWQGPLFALSHDIHKPARTSFWHARSPAARRRIRRPHFGGSHRA